MHFDVGTADVRWAGGRSRRELRIPYERPGRKQKEKNRGKTVIRSKVDLTGARFHKIHRIRAFLGFFSGRRSEMEGRETAWRRLQTATSRGYRRRCRQFKLGPGLH